MKYAKVFALSMLILCAACTKREEPAKVAVPTIPSPIASKVTAAAAKKNLDRELLKISKWFEQMDAILRESLWVVRKDRPPQSKSIFGKMQRAALAEMKEPLPNKSLFRCDTYSMSRTVGANGIPQSAEVLHRCGSKESFARIGDWNHPSANVLTMNFRGGNLDEVLGLATGILSPQISCELKSNDAGNIESFSCKDLMIDYDAKKSQVLKFLRFEYIRGATKVLHLRAEVLESLQPVRKIEADVPMEGTIQVVETVLQAPMVEAKAAPTPVPTANALPNAAEKKPNPQEDPNDPNFNPNRPIIAEPKIPGQGSAGEEGQAESGTIQEVDPNQIQQEQQENRQRQNEKRGQRGDQRDSENQRRGEAPSIEPQNPGNQNPGQENTGPQSAR